MSTVTTFLNLVKPAPLEQFSRSTYNTNLDLIDTNAINTDKQAKGIVATTRYNATSSPTFGKTVFMNIASFTFKANRHYRIAYTGNATISDATSTFVFTLSSCATSDPAAQTTGLTQIRPRALRVDIGGEGRAFDFAANNVSFTSDTTLQIKFVGERLNGGGTVIITGNNTDPCEIVIEDLGMQI